MYCVECGKELPDNSAFCAYCGCKIDTSNDEIKSTEIELGIRDESFNTEKNAGNRILENYELKELSLKQLKGVWGEMALTMFIYFLIVFPIQFIFWEYSPLSNSVLETIITIAIFIVSGPFALGFVYYFLGRIRGNTISLSNIFEGFNNFGKSFLVMLLFSIFVYLWSLLLIIPGIIKSLSYSMAFYILHDNPQISPIDAITESKNMMKGYKGKLFVLYLSFTGWFLLAILTLGIGFLWLSPYVNLSVGNFYENLKQKQEAKNNAN